MAERTPTLRLAPRDLDVIKDVARYKFLSSSQIEKKHFITLQHRKYSNTSTDPEEIAKRLKSRKSTTATSLARLERHNILSRVFAHPKASTAIGRPTAVYYLTSQNLQTIQTHLNTSGQADLFTDIDHLITDKKDKQFSHQHLVHELGISTFFLALEDATQTHGKIIFWERTSPIHKDITERLESTMTTRTKTGTETTTRRILYFNPDAFFCYQDALGNVSFYFLEYDNNTSSLDRFIDKLGGYLTYRARKKFPQLLSLFADRYQLPIPDHIKQQTQFRVLTITPNERRRNNLMREATRVEHSHLFHFAQLPDITPQKVLSPIFLDASTYTPHFKEEKTLPANIRPSVKAQWITERINSMPKVSLLD